MGVREVQLDEVGKRTWTQAIGVSRGLNKHRRLRDGTLDGGDIDGDGKLTVLDIDHIIA